MYLYPKLRVGFKLGMLVIRDFVNRERGRPTSARETNERAGRRTRMRTPARVATASRRRPALAPCSSNSSHLMT